MVAVHMRDEDALDVLHLDAACAQGIDAFMPDHAEDVGRNIFGCGYNLFALFPEVHETVCNQVFSGGTIPKIGTGNEYEAGFVRSIQPVELLHLHSLNHSCPGS